MQTVLMKDSAFATCSMHMVWHVKQKENMSMNQKEKR